MEVRNNLTFFLFSDVVFPKNLVVDPTHSLPFLLLLSTWNLQKVTSWLVQPNIAPCY